MLRCPDAPAHEVCSGQESSRAGSTTSLPRVFTIVLNWNGWKDSIECLESNYRSSYREFEVVFVDNASTDGSLDEIRRWARAKNVSLKTEISLAGRGAATCPASSFEPGGLTVIKTSENLGFSGGNNRGIEYALARGADLIFMLNNDIVVEERTLESLVRAILSRDNMGAVFPLVLGLRGQVQVPVYLRPPQTFWEVLLASNLPGSLLPRYRYRNYLRRRNPYSGYVYDRLIAVPNIAIAGGALFRRELFQEVGLLDENLFMSYEEDVLMQKLRGTRWVVCMEPRARLVHKGGVDSSKHPPAFLHRKRVCGEMYYLRRYMKLPAWQRGVVKLLRVGEYLYFALTKSPDYWTSLPEFSREYVWG